MGIRKSKTLDPLEFPKVTKSPNQAGGEDKLSAGKRAFCTRDDAKEILGETLSHVFIYFILPAIVLLIVIKLGCIG